MQQRREKRLTSNRTCDTVEVTSHYCERNILVSYHHLTRKERGKIALLHQSKATIREISRQLGRNPSTISREIKRNKTEKSYQSDTATEKYQRRRQRCKRKSRLAEEQLVQYIHQNLMLTWSPEQVANRMRLDYPDDAKMSIAHTTIYRWIREEQLERAALLQQKLRHNGHRHGETRGKYHGVRELKERPKEAMKRKRLGDWEVDTIVSSRSRVRDCLLNMVDRKSRYCALVLLKNRAKDVLRGFTFMLSSLPVKTITSDRGKEFACYQEAEDLLNAPFYFTRPYSPWQKGSVENCNGLIRQFFPKGTNFNEIDQESVSMVMQLLNNRPRKCLGWKTPNEVMFGCCCT